jgi:phosphonate transport system permease protein
MPFDAGATPTPLRPRSARLLDWAILAAFVLALALSFGPAQIERAPLLFENSENMRTFAREFLRPDFSKADYFAEQMLLTLQIALWGTTIAVLLGAPLGLLGARNIAPAPVVFIARRTMDVLRSVNEVVLGTIFLVAVGLGPFAGVLAIAAHTTGVLGKLFSEAVESIDMRPVEGVAATGAHPVQVVIWGVAPQVAPLWSSYALYRLESNARSATVLGLIGAGGIGQALFEAINRFAYSETAAIALIVVVIVGALDILSDALRRRLL